jgi:hypothetical protein
MAQRVTIQRIAAIAAMLIASSIAYAEPVHLSCDGQTLTAKRKLLENVTKSLTIDLAAGTVTFDGSGPLGIVPELDLRDATAPETGRLPPLKQPEDIDSVLFIALPEQHLLVEHGGLNRITGEVSVKFIDGAIYGGTCKVARRLF